MDKTEQTLRTILTAMKRLETPSITAIAADTGICECCVEKHLHFAQLLGLIELTASAAATST